MRESMSVPLHCLDQHRAAKATADAFGGDAAFGAEPLHGIHKMQHNAVAAGADRMSETDRSTVDIEFRLINLTCCTVKSQHLAAEPVIVPRGETAKKLRRKRLIYFPSLNVLKLEPVAFQELG